MSAAAGHARHTLALSFPRNIWYIRLYIEAQARWRRMKSSSFRSYVRSPEAILRVVTQGGLKLAKAEHLPSPRESFDLTVLA